MQLPNKGLTLMVQRVVQGFTEGVTGILQDAVQVVCAKLVHTDGLGLMVRDVDRLTGCHAGERQVLKMGIEGIEADLVQKGPFCSFPFRRDKCVLLLLAPILEDGFIGCIRIKDLLAVVAEAHALGQLCGNHLRTIVHMDHGAGP